MANVSRLRFFLGLVVVISTFSKCQGTLGRDLHTALAAGFDLSVCNTLPDILKNNVTDCVLGVPGAPCPDDKISIYYYPNNSTKVLVNQSNADELQTQGWNCEKPNSFLIHGLSQSADEEGIVMVRNAQIANGTHNVFAVDWSNYSQAQCYTGAMLSMRHVGNCVAKVADRLYKLCNNEEACCNTDCADKKTHFVGHSLGAHVAGAACNSTEYPCSCWVTGLDPGIVIFSFQGYSTGCIYVLEPSSAYRTESISTNCGLYGQPCTNRNTQVQFCANGGQTQPECTGKPVNCSHRQAMCYYKHTLTNHTHAPYIGTKTSLDNCILATPPCTGEETAAFGQSKRTNESGVYCLSIPSIDMECVASAI